jgi:nucleotide-binding universal stress UspA family protein
VPVRYDTLVVPVDLSPAAAEVVEHAVSLAKGLGTGRVVLVHAVEPPSGVELEDPVPEDLGADVFDLLRREARDRIQPQLDHFGALGIPAQLEVRSGPAAQAILDVATEVGADLVVMGTRGRTGLRRMVMGSVAESVLRQARVPVVVVRTAETHFPADLGEARYAE